MLSRHNISNAGQALHYFSQDNYYTQEQGLNESQWYGQGAKILNLKGQIGREDFFNVLNGQLQDQELGKWVQDAKTNIPQKEHRCGVDMTFSAPKSVSLLAEIAGKQDVRLAHEEAVKEALNYIEKEFTFTRQTEQGVTQKVQTQNIVVGLFRHNTSRDLDPQTHTHAIIMNATYCKDQKWRSLSNESIYQNRKLIGTIYTSVLAERLQRLGYSLDRFDQHGNFEIVGITQEQIKHFSQRRGNIEANLAAKGINIDTATAQQREEATLKTRNHKVNVDHDDLLTDWKARARAVGIDFAAIKEQAAKNQEKEDSNKITGRQAVDFAIKHLFEREAVISEAKLLSTALEYSVGRVSYKKVLQHVKQLKKEGELVKVSEGLYTSKKMHQSEVWSLNYIEGQKKQTPSIVKLEEARVSITVREKKQGIQYSEGQREALILALTSQDRTIAIQGLAGTGKTTMLRALKDIAQEQDYIVRGMSATGAASKILAKETGILTDTVSMFQIKERQLQKDIALTQKYTTNFTRKSELWIIDESSFLSQSQKVQLDKMAEKAEAKVVYLGDALQLQAVHAGKPFEMAQKQGIDTAYMSEINRQKTASLQKAVNIMTGKAQLIEGQRLTAVETLHNTRAFKYMDKAKMIKEVKDEPIKTLIQDLFELNVEERHKTMIITAFNTDRKIINAQIRDEMKNRGEITNSQTQQIFVSKSWTQAMIKEAQYYQAGDIIRFGRDYHAIEAKKGEYMQVIGKDQSNAILLQKENGLQISWQPHKYNKVEVYESEMRELGKGDIIRFTRNNDKVKNSETAYVVNVSGNRAVVAIGEGEEKSLLTMDLQINKHWEHGYASTVHASQGATKYRTFFYINTQGNGNEKLGKADTLKIAKVFGERSFYVGITRASHHMTIYTNDKNKAAQMIGLKQDKTSVLETIEREDSKNKVIQKTR